ncbi:MAG: hypothetical protein LBK47_08105 [Prevotellaceae bacterium]|jgi:hypothetical protein|nr:hypothetical protein [Prevotellaceae bacterium]
MDKVKTYTITPLKIVGSLLSHVVVIAVITWLLVFIVMQVGLSIATSIGLLMLFALLCIYGIYPIYLCVMYYKYDKDVRLVVNHEIKEVHYVVKNRTIFVIKIDEIVKVKKYYRLYFNFWYYKMIIPDKFSLRVTSLLVPDIRQALKVKIKQIESVDTLHLTPQPNDILHHSYEAI